MTSQDCCGLGNPKTAFQVLKSLREDYHFSDEEVAVMINLTAERVVDFRDFRDAPTLLEKDRIIKMRDLIRVHLHGILTHKGVNQWFHAQLRYLNGKTPLEVLQEDNLSLVYEAASAYVDGAYL